MGTFVEHKRAPSLSRITAALDRKRSHEVVELLARETHTSGVATIMVTHDHEILRHCDRVLEMVDGRLRPHD